MAYGRRYSRRTIRRPSSSLTLPRPTPPPGAELAGAITTTSPHDGVTHADDGRDVVTHVESLETLLAYNETPGARGQDFSHQNCYDNDEDSGEPSIGRMPWRGTRTWSDAVALARDGWPAGAALVDRYASVHADRLASLIEQPVWTMDREGDGFDVGTMLSGEPEHWYHRETRTVESLSRSIYRVRLSVSVASEVRVSAILARGAAIVALVNLLELAGHGTEVTAIYSGCRSSAGRRTVLVTLKRPEHTPDVARLAFALANPAMQRRLLFEAVRHVPRGGDLADLGYGSSSQGFDPPEQYRGDIYLNGATIDATDWTDRAAVSAWIVARLGDCGVTLRERS